ncbi:50S ribosomal protein L13 [Candidatus Aerophobetes bacterium]|nr:50S ribosomal protein L13 [Candidatus Aerophobetes bacterium]
MKTYIPREKEITRNWYLVDAKDKILGRLATKIALLLSGKNKPMYTPHLDTGDFVVVINARCIKVTGKKRENKIYYHHSGYPGGLKKETFEDLMGKKPEEIILKAVKGMLPKNKLGRSMLSKLKVYPEANHPHQSQNPQPIEL